MNDDFWSIISRFERVYLGIFTIFLTLWVFMIVLFPFTESGTSLHAIVVLDIIIITIILILSFVLYRRSATFNDDW